MSDDKIETVRSSSSGVIGRAQSTAHGARVVFDSSSRGALAYRELAKEVSGGTPQRTG